MNHTPGPWNAVGVAGCFVRDSKGRAVAQLMPRGLKETPANARIIAAAPDMAEAMLGLLNYVGGWDIRQDPDHPIVRARTAYEQATGKKL